MDLNTTKHAVSTWLREYWNRLNTGAHQPGRRLEESPIELRRETKNRPLVNLLLFVATFLTTTFAGAPEARTLVDVFLIGMPFSITLIIILLCHEFGHYFAARKFGADPTLPYFIPLPLSFPSPGTMGAVIRTRTPIPSRRALLYIGAMGPLPGFIVSLAAAIIGIYLSDIRPLPVAGSDTLVPILGDSMLFRVLIQIIHGPVPAGHDLYLSQYAWAAWFGLFITSLNLMPIGQLDGSHVLYALIGGKQRLFGWAALAGLAGMAIVWPGWIVWIMLTLFLLMVAHPEIPGCERLTMTEKAIGWSCMVILIITFIPVPLEFL
ncbi:MAG TPA: site-2 protease family protein [Spirochaetota bacterium]|nr:site-2 protease family protein [Spirochaetota bacterium]HOD13423.1 site-2 protease family protein [Spirochaetota bacterium]HPG49372.1 site-2 protease family protein [Spirochaetota bacterium]HPN10611.1 site-2 protease family protein [Spirochaetota bacterium]HQL83295.1 site-2 protease family protein [Spirochaetota bacterium]